MLWFIGLHSKPKGGYGIGNSIKCTPSSVLSVALSAAFAFIMSASNMNFCQPGTNFSMHIEKF